MRTSVNAPGYQKLCHVNLDDGLSVSLDGMIPRLLASLWRFFFAAFLFPEIQIIIQFFLRKMKKGYRSFVEDGE